MQVGISTYSFPWSVGVPNFRPAEPLTYQTLLAYAADHSIPCVQFGDNYPLHSIGEKDLSNLKSLADTYQIQLQVGTRGLTANNIRRYLRIAAKLQSEFIRIVIDDERYRPSKEEVIEIVHELLPSLKQTGVKLAIENHDRFAASVIRSIIEATDPRLVGVCLDTINSLGAGEGLREVVTQLACHTVNLHVKDFQIVRPSHKMGFEVNGCIAGEGMLDIPSLIAQTASYGKCGSATLELWVKPEMSIEETIEKEKLWVKESIRYLKTVIV